MDVAGAPQAGRRSGLPSAPLASRSLNTLFDATSL
jgi:hypothetical protein